MMARVVFASMLPIRGRLFTLAERNLGQIAAPCTAVGNSRSSHGSPHAIGEAVHDQPATFSSRRFGTGAPRTGMSESTQPTELSVDIHGLEGKRMVVLNRPKALNALNLNMIRYFYPRLKEWEGDPDIKLVIIKGAGDKAFCAGGDVLAIVNSAKANDPEHTVHKDFFREEYQLNYLIGTYKIPYVAIIDGITMGGGCGLSMHGRYRVATDRTVLAMPETGLGLFPDVGGSYFLPRLRGHLGMYLALTGYRLKGADVLHAGMATHYVPSDRLEEFEHALVSMRSDDISDWNVDRILSKYQRESAEDEQLPPFSLEPHLRKIDKLFAGHSVEEIFQNLEKDGSDWALKQLATLKKMSPTSLKLTFRLLTEGKKLTYEEIFTQEYRLSQRCCEEGKDFFEGVRAILVAKDNKPKWDPPTLEGVTKEKVDWYFSPLPDDRDLHLAR